MATIVELAKKYRTDKKVPDGIPAQNMLKGHGYAATYDMLLSGRTINTILEIGVSYGGSIKMWAEYFKDAMITGIDISDQRFNPKELIQIPNVNIIIGDATKKKEIDRLDTFDLIIDDGSHYDLDIISSFYHLYKHLNYNGMYIIEDLHVSNKINPMSAYNILKNMNNVEFYNDNKLAVLWKL